MKNLMTAFFMMASVLSYAQDTSLVQPPILPPYSEQEVSRDKIQMRDLPEAVREALKEPDYAGWTVNAVHKAVMDDSKKPESESLIVYIVELKRKDEKTAIRFDKDGKRLDDNDNK
jgi:hypothetical protein